ncbi:hypothetical protein Pr1d_31850 [Bythopirellula goksoeyrii]|uniref:Lipoprotein n=1 Tax=Bythopirellula goksoeyrii TaxID=1400387 RepID=A0A5B9QDK2_9BACT|nr:hypothetical protein Pr1d_31850 [Bythopirellula goksoeyrii]
MYHKPLFYRIALSLVGIAIVVGCRSTKKSLPPVAALQTPTPVSVPVSSINENIPPMDPNLAAYLRPEDEKMESSEAYRPQASSYGASSGSGYSSPRGSSSSGCSSGCCH